MGRNREAGKRGKERGDEKRGRKRKKDALCSQRSNGNELVDTLQRSRYARKNLVVLYVGSVTPREAKFELRTGGVCEQEAEDDDVPHPAVCIGNDLTWSRYCSSLGPLAGVILVVVLLHQLVLRIDVRRLRIEVGSAGGWCVNLKHL
jgi:hypothetical protein